MTVRPILLAAFAATVLAAQAPDTLPGTARWDFPPDIAAEQYRELRAFYEREVAAAAAARRPFPDPAAARREFRALIGAIDTYDTPRPRTEPLADFGPFTASLVDWPILRSGSEPPTTGSAGTAVREYGILLAPKTPGRHLAVVVIADADRSAADIAGLTPRTASAEQTARQLAARGLVVFAPFFTQRRAISEPWTDDRSWLFRLAYQTGHHLIGSEVQQVSAAYDYLAGLPGVDPARIAVAGHGQGGLTALYAAALDERLRAALVTGYLGRLERPWDDPEDRLVWKRLVQFPDDAIASLVAPRELITEGGIERLARAMDAGPEAPAQAGRPITPDRLTQIANAQFNQWQARYRNAALESYAVREAAWRPDTSSLDAYSRWLEPKRELYLDTVGRYPEPRGPLESRSVKLYDEPGFSGYRLSVRVYDGVHAYGILLLPRDLKPGERRPVVFTQHGFGGKPEDALGVVPRDAADAVYARFGLRLAQRGYIVFAPMISTQTSPERDGVTRRAHLVGQIPVGLETKKFGRVLDYLSTLPFVDPRRFAFYGLSYGGYTALWSGPGEPRFQVVICSGHFNDWTVKTTDPTQGTSFLFYPHVLDMFNFGLLPRLGHAELAMLVAPRAFLIEVGDRDGVVVAPRRFADAEMQRVEGLYRALGIPDRGQVARFPGPHKVDGTAAFAFLDRWLDWKR